MKKTDNKSDKKKTGKKKNTQKGGVFDINSKQLQKEFNKRMKVLVQEVKKDTQKTIKTLVKEARQKIHASSDFVMNDVLKTIVTQYEHITGTEHGDNKPARKTRAKAPDTGTPAAAPKSATQKPAATRQAKASGTGTTRATGTRKTAPQVAGTNLHGQEQAA